MAASNQEAKGKPLSPSPPKKKEVLRFSVHKLTIPDIDTVSFWPSKSQTLFINSRRSQAMRKVGQWTSISVAVDSHKHIYPRVGHSGHTITNRVKKKGKVIYQYIDSASYLELTFGGEWWALPAIRERFGNDLTTATIPESGKSNPKKKKKGLSIPAIRDANLCDLFCAIAVFFFRFKWPIFPLLCGDFCARL